MLDSLYNPFFSKILSPDFASSIAIFRDLTSHEEHTSICFANSENEKNKLIMKMKILIISIDISNYYFLMYFSFNWLQSIISPPFESIILVASSGFVKAVK